MRWGSLLIVLWLTGCGDSEGVGGAGAGGDGGADAGGAPSCEPDAVQLSDGSCIMPGVQPDGCPAGTWADDPDGPCRPAGVQANGCDAGTLMVEGACVPAGIPEDGCGDGFEPDGDQGCTAILPPTDCGYGQMAVMGETSCRPVAPCEAGPFGSIPVDGQTEFVDGAFAGASDGTELAPWKTIQDALDAASPGDIVAIAEGVYAEDLTLDKPVQLWGRCPELVELAGSGGPATLSLGPASEGSEIRDLAITGIAVGIDMAGASNVVLDRIWLHDTGDWGIGGVDAVPATAFTMTRSLVEFAYDTSLHLYGTDAVIEASVIRDSISTPTRHGWAITLQEDESTLKRPRMELRDSLIERNAEVALPIFGGEALIERVYVRDTAPRPSGMFGRGIALQTGALPGSGSVVTMTESIIENSHETAAFVSGSSLTLRNTVIRDTEADGLGSRGYGVGTQIDPLVEDPSSLEISHCLIERSTSMGILVGAGVASVEGTLVRDTRPHSEGVFGRGMTAQSLPQFSNEGADVRVVGSSFVNNVEVGVFLEGGRLELDGVEIVGTRVGQEPLQGFGLAAQDDPNTGERANVWLRGSRLANNHSIAALVVGADLDMQGTLLEGTVPVEGANTGPLFGRGASIQVNWRSGATANASIRGSALVDNAEAGLFLSGGEATIEGVLVRDVALTQSLSRGINIQGDFYGGVASSAEIRSSVIEGTREVGLFIAGADVTLESSVVREVRATDALFGDGVELVSSTLPTSGTILRSLVESNDRAGIASFGAHARLEASVVRCNGIDLVGEELNQPYVFDDAGGNLCDCDGAMPCRVLSSNLSPPTPLEEAPAQ